LGPDEESDSYGIAFREGAEVNGENSLAKGAQSLAKTLDAESGERVEDPSALASGIHVELVAGGATQG
jgi:hypothetical protein